MLRPHRDRITWDANIHCDRRHRGAALRAADGQRQALALRAAARALRTYDYCAERGIGMYGGGQFELGPGRGQIQYLASLFHPDTPNDVAPGGYNDADAARRPAGQPARGRRAPHRLPLGLTRGPPRRSAPLAREHVPGAPQLAVERGGIVRCLGDRRRGLRARQRGTGLAVQHERDAALEEAAHERGVDEPRAAAADPRLDHDSVEDLDRPALSTCISVPTTPPSLASTGMPLKAAR